MKKYHLQHLKEEKKEKVLKLLKHLLLKEILILKEQKTQEQLKFEMQDLL